MLWEDAERCFDAVVGEIEGVGSTQKKTPWMTQGWHRRKTWLRWLKELRGYMEDQHTMALAHIIAAEKAEQQVTALTEALKEVEQHCPCGARPESLRTHPHVGGCPVGNALALSPAEPEQKEKP